MGLDKKLDNYAKLIAKVGLNVQKDQPVLVRATTDTRNFVVKVVKACYELGASKVEVEWRDQELTKLNLTYQSEESLSNVSQWYVDHYQETLENGAAFLSIIGDDPDGLAGVDSNKMKASLVGRSKALRNYMKSIMSDECPWSDLIVGLPEGHIWQSAGSYAKKAGRFVANIPTEEVFTMPHKDVTSGIVYNAKPLNHGGVLIDDFWLKFENGKVVDYDAKRGYDALKNILETDEGARSIGEMALVPFDSPISNTGILFLETLFDENAACHIALGKAYPTCVEGGSEMSDEELAAVGANDSLVHVDFMVGEGTTNIVGITKDGREVQIFKDGNWA